MSGPKQELQLIKHKYTKTRHQLQNFYAVYAEMLHIDGHEGDYFKARIDEMKAEAKALEQKYQMLGGNVSRLD